MQVSQILNFSFAKLVKIPFLTNCGNEKKANLQTVAEFAVLENLNFEFDDKIH